MDDSSKSLQAKLSELSQQLSNQSPTLDELRRLKGQIQEVIEELEGLSLRMPQTKTTSIKQ